MAKLDANRQRDERVRELLADLGWRVATIWECALRNPAQVLATCDRLAAWIESAATCLVIEEADLVASTSASSGERNRPR